MPLYSTSWDNIASQQVAKKLGLRWYGVNFSCGVRENTPKGRDENGKTANGSSAGFFDGVHQGHRRVIEKAVSLANGHLIPAVFTFTMHEGGPSKKQGAGEITTLEQKIRILKKMGIPADLCA